MPEPHLIINVRFEGEATFSGISPDPAHPYEWPPAPARLLSALIAGAAASPEFEEILTYLRRLEECEDPMILAGGCRDPRDPLHYTPKVSDYPTETWTLDKLGDLAPPGASRKAKAYENSLRKGVWTGFKGMSETGSTGKYINGARPLTDPEVTYAISPPAEVTLSELKRWADALDTAASGVAYLGSSSDIATLTARTGTLDILEKRHRKWHQPVSLHGNIRGWASGLVDHQLARYRGQMTAPGHDIGHPDHLTRALTYLSLVDSPTTTSLIMATSPVPRPMETAACMQKLSALMSDHSDSIRILPMFDHRHPHSSGRLMGVMLISPKTNDGDVRRTIASTAVALTESGDLPWLDPSSASLTGLQVPSPIPGAPDREKRHLVSLTPGSVLGKSRRWRSTSPVRSYPGSEYARARMLIDLAKETELPYEAISIRIRPADTSTKRYGRLHSLGPVEGKNLAMVPWQVEVEFDEIVAGPIQIGADKHLGYGLLVPDDTGKEPQNA